MSHLGDKALPMPPAMKRQLEEEAHRKKYPMCTRLALERATKMKILDFLDFLSHEGISLCNYDEKRFSGSYWPIDEQGEKLVHKYLDIDDAALERERRQMIDELEG